MRRRRQLCQRAARAARAVWSGQSRGRRPVPARREMSRLRTRIATAEGKQRYVRTLCATIADRYDLITVLLSYGQDQRWKRRLVDLAAPAPGMRVLDLATGTGDLAYSFTRR